MGGNLSSMEHRASTTVKVGNVRAAAAHKGGKVSFYFTNFPDFMPVVQLRQLCSLVRLAQVSLK